MMRLPGLIDVHVHIREPGAPHKEDWSSGTGAALAGGITAVLAMPNTQPPVTDAASLELARQAASAGARCDYGLFLGATTGNTALLGDLSSQVVGLKMYLDRTYGPLHLVDSAVWERHFEGWPAARPLPVHAEGTTLAAALQLAERMGRSLHVCHISRREEVLLVRAAKERGAAVTCEVTPHHLFLCEDDVPRLGPGRSLVLPPLGRRSDQEALWENLEIIDCFATDHAPHTLAEKECLSPPPGLPGLEAMLPLLLTAVHERRLTLEDIVARLHLNPCRIFGLTLGPETFVDVDLDARWELSAKTMHTRCAWTPYEGWPVRGLVRRVVVRGLGAFDGDERRMLAQPGAGRDLRSREVAITAPPPCAP